MATRTRGPAGDTSVDLDVLRNGHSLEELFVLLSSSRRRFVLYYLCRRERPVELGELSKEIAAHETGVLVDLVKRDRYHSVYITLYQCHLPKLDAMGIVEYDDQAQTVTLTPRTRRALVRPSAFVGGRPWATYYAAIGIVGLLFGGGLLLTAGPGSSSTWVALALLVSIALLVVGVARYRHARDVPDAGRYIRLEQLL